MSAALIPSAPAMSSGGVMLPSSITTRCWTPNPTAASGGGRSCTPYTSPAGRPDTRPAGESSLSGREGMRRTWLAGFLRATLAGTLGVGVDPLTRLLLHSLGLLSIQQRMCIKTREEQG